MSAKRIIALVFIYCVACAGWMILGTVTSVRSIEYSENLSRGVEELWGSELLQQAPRFTFGKQEKPIPVMPLSNKLDIEINIDYRKKGLVWYSTFVCSFDALYTIENPVDAERYLNLHFNFPSKGGTYDQFGAYLDGERMDIRINTREGIHETIIMKAKQKRSFRITYKTRGLNEWKYIINPEVGRVQNLAMTVTTDFEDVDYPEGTLSPMETEPEGDGMKLSWTAEDLITSQHIGVKVPDKLNPGPLASRITFFAPVCLIFFFVLVVTISLIQKIGLHPMHYLFVAAGFFSFHLLFNYFVDIINIHVSFWLSAIASILLVNIYLRGTMGKGFPWITSTGAQVFFLVLFSYSFFIKGMTGLTVSIGSVVTLAVLMKVTAHIDWEEVFNKPARKRKSLKPAEDAS